jgi:hypothetical protein
MLSTGGALFIAFIVWEWKMAKLPMMPGKYLVLHSQQSTLLTQQTISSQHL